MRFFRSQIALFHINIANTVSNTAPGIPNIPTTSAVTTFIPICNPHTVPTILITYNNTAPKKRIYYQFNNYFYWNYKYFSDYKYSNYTRHIHQ